MKKAVLYARVSTRDQQREGYSIPQQIKFIYDYARKNGYPLIKEFIDVESASKTGRKNFNKMIKFVKDNPSVEAIICHKVDRLCRNFKDYVTIDELKVKPLFVEEEFPETAAGKLTFGMKILLAKWYCDNLSEETKKGQRGKLEVGGWPGGACPTGYRKVNRDLVPEEPAASLIRRMFEYYASGLYSAKTLKKKMDEEGLRSRTTKRLTTSNVHRLLTNPIYCGIIRWNGKLYQGKQQPIITRELFDQVQEMLNRKNIPKTQKHFFLFRGFLRCGECGCGITAETKKGHVYYHCCFYKPCHQRHYIREEVIEEQILEILKNLKIGEKTAESVKETLKESHAEEMDYHNKVVKGLNEQFEMLQKRLDVLYDDKVDGKIDEGFYNRKFNQYTQERGQALDQIRRHTNANKSYFELGCNILDLANRAAEIYRRRSPEQKRLLLKILTSNLIMKDKKLDVTLRIPFNYIFQEAKTENWLPG